MLAHARLCSCGKPIGPTGECAACAAKRQAGKAPAPAPAREAAPQAAGAAPAHSFSAVAVHTPRRARR
jgi:hypothetical protein